MTARPYLPLPHVAGHAIPFALQARAWSDHVVVFGQHLDEAARTAIASAGIPVHTSPIVHLVGGFAD